MKFGDTLKSLIELSGLTQKELAVLLNMAPSTLGNYVQNIREPDFETLKLFAAHFKVSIDSLLDYHSELDFDHMEQQILFVFRQLSPEYKTLYIEQGKTMVKYQNTTE